MVTSSGKQCYLNPFQSSWWQIQSFRLVLSCSYIPIHSMKIYWTIYKNGNLFLDFLINLSWGTSSRTTISVHIFPIDQSSQKENPEKRPQSSSEYGWKCTVYPSYSTETASLPMDLQSGFFLYVIVLFFDKPKQTWDFLNSQNLTNLWSSNMAGMAGENLKKT